MSKDKPLSEVEGIKTRSRLLRGTLAEGLQDLVTGAIADDDTQLSKFHGIYMQDDRDVRAERRKQKLEPAYSFMIRARVPAGLCTPAQWLAMDQLARTHANGSLRLTTRQAFQFHGVIKTKLKATIAGINETLLDTLAACGDVNRNVMATPVAENTRVHAAVADWAQKVSDHLTPRTGAYHEIWLDGEKIVEADSLAVGVAPEAEPIYGSTYLPRKFKMALVIPPSNDVDIFAQDLGFIAIVEQGELAGFNVTVGGGMGMAHGLAETYPRLGDVIGFVAPEDLIAISEAVVTTQRDHGDRSNRKHARLKYTIDDLGLDWFKGEVEARSGVTLAPARPSEFSHRDDPAGWLRDDAGFWHYTVFAENGRVADTESRALMSGLRALAETGIGEFRLTANQNVILSNISDADKPAVEAIIEDYGLEQGVTPLRLNAMACVGFPTCGLAMAESERYLPSLVDRLDDILLRHGLEDEPIVIRMTGCPNGCARPYVAEIGLVGKSADRYNLFLGGGFDGRRLNRLHLESATEEDILQTLEPLIGDFAAERQGDEPFGDFLVRVGHVKPVAAGPQVHQISGATS